MWKEPDGVQKARAGDTGIGQGYNHQQMKASPNPHLSPTFPFICLLLFYHLYILLASTIPNPTNY
jgi:hypothetical protein